MCSWDITLHVKRYLGYLCELLTSKQHAVLYNGLRCRVFCFVCWEYIGRKGKFFALFIKKVRAIKVFIDDVLIAPLLLIMEREYKFKLSRKTQLFYFISAFLKLWFRVRHLKTKADPRWEYSFRKRNVDSISNIQFQVVETQFRLWSYLSGCGAGWWWW